MVAVSNAREIKHRENTSAGGFKKRARLSDPRLSRKRCRLQVFPSSVWRVDLSGRVHNIRGPGTLLLESSSVLAPSLLSGLDIGES